MSQHTKDDWEIRVASPGDSSELVVLIDIASRGLLTWLWTQIAPVGQSPLEIGRERIRTRMDLPTYFANWEVATKAGEIAGGLAGYRIAVPYDPGDISDLPPLYEPLLELESIAAGTWHLMTLAVYPEFRKQGIGSMLLKRAEALSVSSGCSIISIMANSANEGACRLYLNSGYTLNERRPCIPFPNSEDHWEWFLFQKSI
ncbi:GNAT family N-acetyltransferase [Mesorhizobium mediterraneum]|uniref:GNAT family N-acetyltransferase n=1 Tax=Mesorhizobium mediterraneum TaxID=43617 RepID=UPI00177DB000|nr:GNAT family N-acetyltransferase [Mesorhizobium mediterraneum]